MKTIINMYNNKILINFSTLLLLFLLVGCSIEKHVVKNNSIPESSSLQTKSPLTLNLESTDSVKAVISFNNQGKDTLYLFSSYFEKDIYFNSEHLNRIIPNRRVKKLSFLPLIPYLSQSYSDRIILGKYKVTKNGQILYEFIPLPPGEKTEITIFINPDVEFYSKDFPFNRINIFSTIQWETIKNDSEINNYEQRVEFAVYKKVDQILDRNVFYNTPKLYNDLVKDYEIKSIKITNPDGADL